MVLVSLDTLRADRLGAYGHPGGLTPNLDRLAGESVLFEAAFSQSNQTVLSHGSLMTSRYPSELGWIGPSYRVPASAVTLAEALSAYGYACGAFVGGGHLSPEFGIGQGFAPYEATAQWGSLWHTAPRALAWLDGLPEGQRSFVFVHGYDAHMRYLKPTPFGYLHADARAEGVGAEVARQVDGTARVADGLVFDSSMPLEGVGREFARPRSPEARAVTARRVASGTVAARPVGPLDVDHLRRVYDGAVSYLDAQVGLLMAGLEARGRLDDTLLIVFADHGEALGEGGLFNHRARLADEELHVPLLVRLPGGDRGGARVAGLVELIDVLPTVLEMASARPPAGIRGRSLIPAVRGGRNAARGAAFSQGSLRMVSLRVPDGRLTFAGLSGSSPFLPEVVRAASLDGPAFEATPGMSTARREDLREVLAGWAEGLDRPADGGAPLPEALLRELQARGYWGGEP